MGSGIAQFFAANSLQVTLYDTNAKALAKAKEKIQQLQATGSAGLDYGQVTYTSELREAIGQADLIIESVPEDLAIKLQLYTDIAPFLKEDAVVASNTSTFALASLSANQPFGHRMIIMHFFNPAHLIPLVELVDSDKTLPDIITKITGFLCDCGKKPVILKKDIYGFIGNRLQAAVLREACFLLENGIADAGQIDRVMKEGLGMRWVLNGPFEIADLGGLEIWEKVLANLLPLLDDNRLVPDIIRQKVENRQLGLKTGKGFFEYSQQSSLSNIEEGRNQKLSQIQRLLNDDRSSPQI